jgi:hypothetical protein
MSASQDDKTSELIQRLTRRTQASKLRWAVQADDATAFSVSLENGSISIYSRDGDGLPPTRIDILNPDGVVVRSVESETSEVNPASNPLYGLWLAVRDSAGPAGPVLDGLLQELDDDIPF